MVIVKQSGHDFLQFTGEETGSERSSESSSFLFDLVAKLGLGSRFSDFQCFLLPRATSFKEAVD